MLSIFSLQIWTLWPAKNIGIIKAKEDASWMKMGEQKNQNKLVAKFCDCVLCFATLTARSLVPLGVTLVTKRAISAPIVMIPNFLKVSLKCSFISVRRSTISLASEYSKPEELIEWQIWPNGAFNHEATSPSAQYKRPLTTLDIKTIENIKRAFTESEMSADANIAWILCWGRSCDILTQQT